MVSSFEQPGGLRLPQKYSECNAWPPSIPDCKVEGQNQGADVQDQAQGDAQAGRVSVANEAHEVARPAQSAT
eukprot:scaffold289886_cov27-Prasinocladus_malaysianus.AAC.1